MKIKKVEINNYRSIKYAVIEPQCLCAFVGENNSGKSNILYAVDLILGENWPTTRQISDEDIYNKDTRENIEIKIWFDEGFIYTDATGKNFDIKGFLLRYTHYKRKSGRHVKGDPKLEFLCIDENGNEIKVIKKLPKAGSGHRPIQEPLYVNSEYRDKFPVVFIGVNRNLKYHLSGSQWTLFGKLLKEIEREFLSDESRRNDYIKKMDELSILLRIPTFETMEKLIQENVKRQTGFKEAKLGFKEPSILSHYRNLELNVKESDEFPAAPALEMGSGIQSAIVIALIQAYRELQKSGAILMIEEPEVYLHPHTRRFFYQILNELANQNNQIFYTTHSVEFLDLSNYQFISVVRKSPSEGTEIYQPKKYHVSLGTKKELKLLTEFDARRNELFFARRVMLVEGQTEKHSLPFAFKLMGIDINEDGISIIDTGGKENIPFFVEILKAFHIPFVILHDEDRTANNYLSYHNGPTGLNKKIENICNNPAQIFKTDPNYDEILKLGAGNKIKQARERMSTFTDKDQLPDIIRRCIKGFKQD